MFFKINTRMVEKNRNVNVYSQLVNGKQFRLNKINKIKDFLLLKFVSIASFATLIDAPVGVISASLTLLY